jgi:hypothetical protein
VAPDLAGEPDPDRAVRLPVIKRILQDGETPYRVGSQFRDITREGTRSLEYVLDALTSGTADERFTDYEIEAAMVYKRLRGRIKRLSIAASKEADPDNKAELRERLRHLQGIVVRTYHEGAFDQGARIDLAE